MNALKTHVHLDSYMLGELRVGREDSKDSGESSFFPII